MSEQHTHAAPSSDTTVCAVPLWLVRSRVSDGAVRLYAEIAHLAALEPDGGTRVARKVLGATLGVPNPKEISRRINELETAGALIVERADTEVNRYTPVTSEPA